MRTFLFFFLFVILMPLMALADNSGSCGENVTYTYVEETRTLTITGSGDMTKNGAWPWSSYKTEIVKVIIEDGVTSIGNSSFDGCSSLMDISISNSVKKIEYEAFHGCISLTSIAIPASVIEIESGAFNGCSELKSVHISDVAAWCNIKFSYGWAMNNLYSNPLYYAHHLYLDGEEIKELVIPDGVTAISDFAFLDCDGLTSVTIPNSVVSLGNASFCWCSGITSISIGSGITSFGEKTFQGCLNMVTATITEGVTTIGKEAFISCSSLISINIPNSVTSIGEKSFYGCEKLKNVFLPDNITMIRNETFSGCKSLNSITIPAKVEYVYQRAFENCGLEEVKVFADTPPQAYDNSFSNYNIPLYCPEASVNTYQSTMPWSNFASYKTLDGKDMETKQCAKPVITYANGKLTFTCDTEGVEFVTTISDTDVKSYYSNEIELTVTYNVCVYASATGYKDSEIVTATLCWVDVDPKTEGISNGVAQVRAYAVMIQSNAGTIRVSGVDDGSDISVFSASGHMECSAKAHGNQVSLVTNLKKGEVALVKIGDKSVKVVME